MAQRAIREKTKHRISELEAIIDNLKNSDHNKELQAAIQAKEAAEAENAEIKRQLAAVMATLREVIGPRQPGPEEHAYASPASQAYLSMKPQYSIVSPPTSAKSPMGMADGHAQGAAQHAFSPSTQHMQALVRQKEDMQRGLEMGQDRVNLGGLVDMPPSIPGFMTMHGRDAAVGSNIHPYYNPSTQYNGGMQQPPLQQGPVSPHHLGSQPIPGSSHHLRHSATPSQPDMYHYHSPGQEPPVWATPTLLGPGTCMMDDILLKFLKERRDLLAQGQPRSEVVGPPYPSVASLLNRDTTAHPLSEIFTRIIRTFPNLDALPEQLATVYLMFLNVRWQVEPTKENYDRLLPFTRPIPLQQTTPHPAWVDHIPWPMMRDKMIRSPGEYDLNDFFVPYTSTLSVNWPYDDSYVLIQNPETEEITINPVFDLHVRNLENWTMGVAFARKFPELQGTYRLNEGGSA